VYFVQFGFAIPWQEKVVGVFVRFSCAASPTDLPSISNWWSGILLLFLLGFFWVIEKRLDRKIHRHNRRIILLAPFLAFTHRVSVCNFATSFTNEYKPFLEQCSLYNTILNFIIPVYYSEFILGFILGVIHHLWAIIPTVFILIIAVLVWMPTDLSGQ
jgi:hypothetical protein